MPVSQGRRNIEERRNGAPKTEETPVVCRNSTAPPRRQSEPTSRGLSVVEAEKAAEPSPTADLSNAVRGLGGRDQVVVESLSHAARNWSGNGSVRADFRADMTVPKNHGFADERSGRTEEKRSISQRFFTIHFSHRTGLVYDGSAAFNNSCRCPARRSSSRHRRASVPLPGARALNTERGVFASGGRSFDVSCLTW